MFGKKFNFLIVLSLFFLLVVFAAGCDGRQRSAKTPESQVPTQSESKAEIDIKGIEVHSGDRIIFSGETTLPEGSCIESQLFENGVPLGWWPSNECFSVTGADWQFAVPLSEDGRPENLEDSSQYQLQVWWADAPEETVDNIYFDLAGPQSP